MGGSGTCPRSRGQEAVEPTDALTIQGSSLNPSTFTPHSQKGYGLLVWGGPWDGTMERRVLGRGRAG